jgi:ribosomal protein S18 acetylase RimI-like enzyme
LTHGVERRPGVSEGGLVAVKKTLQTVRVRIHRMQPADIDACADIVAGDPLWRRYGMTRARAARAFRRALAVSRDGRRLRGPSLGGQIAIARHRGRVVGFVWFRLDGTFDHSGYVRWIAVARDSRARGIGRALMRYAEERIFRKGPNVFLMVSEFNRRAQGFYRRQGYTKVGAVDDYVASGITERLYRKTRGPIMAQRRRVK